MQLSKKMIHWNLDIIDILVTLLSVKQKKKKKSIYLFLMDNIRMDGLNRSCYFRSLNFW